MPSNRFPYEDEGGEFLVEEEGCFLTYGTREEAEDRLKYMGIFIYEDIEYPVNEFEVVEI